MRSLLFVPGDSRRKLEKAFASEADALILDLEDAVAPPSKEAARACVAAILSEIAPPERRVIVYVRVNSLRSGLIDDDLAAVLPGRPDGIVLPKAEGGRDVSDVATRLSVLESALGLPTGATGVLPIATETAAGVLAIGTIPGASARLVAVTWGGEDLAADLGAETNRDAQGIYTAPFRHARTMTLLTATAAGVAAIDAVYTDYQDPDGLAEECRLARRDGFSGKLAIHPAQVPIINAGFAPTPAAIAWAHEIIAMMSSDHPTGVASLRGRMIDRPHVLQAERILAQIQSGQR
jgi:citrate lyase subunit beta/citryl-CoA lyase